MATFSISRLKPPTSQEQDRELEKAMQRDSLSRELSRFMRSEVMEDFPDVQRLLAEAIESLKPDPPEIGSIVRAMQRACYGSPKTPCVGIAYPDGLYMWRSEEFDGPKINWGNVTDIQVVGHIRAHPDSLRVRES